MKADAYDIVREADMWSRSRQYLPTVFEIGDDLSFHTKMRIGFSRNLVDFFGDSILRLFRFSQFRSERSIDEEFMTLDSVKIDTGQPRYYSTLKRCEDNGWLTTVR